MLVVAEVCPAARATVVGVPTVALCQYQKEANGIHDTVNDLPLELTRELRRATDTLEAVHRTEGLRNELYSSRKKTNSVSQVWSPIVSGYGC